METLSSKHIGHREYRFQLDSEYSHSAGFSLEWLQKKIFPFRHIIPIKIFLCQSFRLFCYLKSKLNTKKNIKVTIISRELCDGNHQKYDKTAIIRAKVGHFELKGIDFKVWPHLRQFSFNFNTATLYIAERSCSRNKRIQFLLIFLLCLHVRLLFRNTS